MEIFMDNISWNVNRYEVQRQLANILHREPFASLSPSIINFDVTLIRTRGSRQGHRGKGYLTLPTWEVGLRFLHLSEQSTDPFPVYLDGRRLKFSQSNHSEARPDILETIRLSPYIDPQAQEEREARIAEFKAAAISIDSLQFGWECRDKVFSIEWEHPCEDTCWLELDEEKELRHIRITLLHQRHQYIISIPYSHLLSTYIHPTHPCSYQGEPAIVFSLDLPPTYQLDSFDNHSWELLDLVDPETQVFDSELLGSTSRKMRLRLSHLPFGEHDQVAPYTSLAVRVVFSDSNSLSEFYSLARKAHLHHVYRREYPTARRQLFSTQKLADFRKWLRFFHWRVAFQLLAIVQSSFLDVTEVLDLMPNINDICTRRGQDFTAAVLQKFGCSLKMSPIDSGSEEVNLLARLLQIEEDHQTEALPYQPRDLNLCDVFHVTITPTTTYLEGPMLERSNRVLRRYVDYQDSFLRVTFSDEGGLKYRFDRDTDGRAFIRSRVGTFLSEGLNIAQRHFKFLAYSQSALKEHCVWFVKPFYDLQTEETITAETIIEGLGNFDDLSFDMDLMRCPARYGARISQAFTATTVSIQVEADEIFTESDISTLDGKYHFTDGVGTISRELAEDIILESKRARKKHRNLKVSAFQIRLQGSKGMLSVNHRLSGRAVVLRQSMIKFEAPDSMELEVARLFDKPGLYYLNRPLIMLLEGLGVPYGTFKKYQDLAIDQTQQACLSLGEAARLLENYGLGASYRLPSVLINLEKLYVDSLRSNAFYEQMLEYSINHVLRELKYRARIPIPSAWSLVGVADVHHYLRPNQIFACVKPVHGKAIHLEGPVLISRSPTIHPGDVTIVEAIGRPPVGSPFEKEPLPNTVVFSVLGNRPVSSCLGGGDLDGDVYNLIPLQDLPEFRPSEAFVPASYEPAQKMLLEDGQTCVMEDVADFFMEYINSDVLGIIASNWLIIADQSCSVAEDDESDERGIFSTECLTLAQLHSDAVDYPKSGRPVDTGQIPKLKFRMKPDWSAPETLMNRLPGQFYQSGTALGRLFREIKLPVEGSRIGREEEDDSDVKSADSVADLSPGLSINAAVEEKVMDYTWISEPSADEYASMDQLFRVYVDELGQIRATHTITHNRNSVLSEEEVVVGTIAQKTPQPQKRKVMMKKLHESTDILVGRIRLAIAGDDDMSSEDALRRAWVAWKFAVKEGETFGAQSFSWISLGAIFEAIKELDEEEKAREEMKSSVCRQLPYL